MRKNYIKCDVCKKEVEEDAEEIKDWTIGYNLHNRAIDACDKCKGKLKEKKEKIYKIRDKATADIQKEIEKLTK